MKSIYFGNTYMLKEKAHLSNDVMVSVSLGLSGGILQKAPSHMAQSPIAVTVVTALV
jgi:hypothetical protein